MQTAEKTALITGITGQDGSYLAELLLAKGYTVHGVVRRTSNLLRSRIEHLRQKSDSSRIVLHYSDLSDGTSLRRIFARARPAEIYHLAGQSHVGLSFQIPESTCEEVAMATLRLLEIARDQTQPVRCYHASSSEIFGSGGAMPQNGRDAVTAGQSLRLREGLRYTNGAEFTGNPTASLFATEFSIITSRPGAAKILSPAKSRGARRGSPVVSITSWSLVISRAGAIGDTRRIMLRRCG